MSWFTKGEVEQTENSSIGSFSVESVLSSDGVSVED